MKTLRGIPAAPGIAIGLVHSIRPTATVDITAQHAGDVANETSRLTEAIKQAIIHLDSLRSNATGATADILAAQREMLDDPELKEGADTFISSGFTAAAAITRIASDYAEQLASLPDPYLSARAEDVREASRRIVAELQGTSLEIHLTRPSILVAQDLAPAETVNLDPKLLQAIVTETGSATGHLAIVAQGLGIPTVVGVSGILSHVDDNTTLIVDGERGIVTIDPDEETITATILRLNNAQREKHDLEIYRDRIGVTADGIHIEVFANIGSVIEAHKAIEMGAEGVGLFRTELIAAHGLPSEEAQATIYEEIATVLQRPLIVRTFDIGGDKPVPGLDIPPEANPFLGWRGIRLALDRPEEVFLPQIRALLHVGTTHDIRIMLPMITTPEEVIAARTLIEQAMKDMTKEGHPVRRIPIGIMVETPAAAVTLDLFRGLIDFASIGTNDLVQYTYAVDRTNAQVRDRAKPLGSATLRLIAQICRANIPVAICGQLASNIEAIPLLVGLGVRELSVAPVHIPTVKRVLSTMTLLEMQEKAARSME